MNNVKNVLVVTKFNTKIAYLLSVIKNMFDDRGYDVKVYPRINRLHVFKDDEEIRYSFYATTRNDFSSFRGMDFYEIIVDGEADCEDIAKIRYEHHYPVKVFMFDFENRKEIFSFNLDNISLSYYSKYTIKQEEE